MGIATNSQLYRDMITVLGRLQADIDKQAERIDQLELELEMARAEMPEHYTIQLTAPGQYDLRTIGAGPMRFTGMVARIDE